MSTSTQRSDPAIRPSTAPATASLDSEDERYVPGEALWALLIQTGAVSEEFAQQYQRPRKPLGAILVNAGQISIKGIAKLLAIQAMEPQMKIGDLAVREGYCTPKEIAAALSLQNNGLPTLEDAFLEDERVNKRALIRALITHIERLETRGQVSRTGE